jgi:hypothetical protein
VPGNLHISLNFFRSLRDQVEQVGGGRYSFFLSNPKDLGNSVGIPDFASCLISIKRYKDSYPP